VPNTAGQAPEPTGDGADGGDRRYNRLMQAHGRTVTRAEQAERERDELRAQIEERDAELAGYRAAGQAPDDGDDTSTVADEQAGTQSDDTQDGDPEETYDGAWPSTDDEPPTPKVHNEARTITRPRTLDDMSVSELQQQLDQQVGLPTRNTSAWPS
jgi:hypothetical protein